MTTPNITGAIAQAQDVFGSVPAARQALEYLSATLAAEAEARAADEWRERALKAEAQLAAGGANASIAEGTHTSAGAEPVAAPSWSIGGQASSTHFDQAAAAMAAEFAQKLADAERVVAREAVAAGVDPLSVLSREVNGLSNKLQLPTDVTVQLLVLAELRGVRSDLRRSATAR